ncbi:suppressor of glycerol defect [Steccherinum ochraceum]|uniref:Suppressor of glycerol defect n=1 Tax=Steccherinum ochraceum TaxID=92696 RepID=A0A4R0RSQ2_9APHY|nr:suppressor of glycerol defect [Steccherinum ochraceum]
MRSGAGPSLPQSLLDEIHGAEGSGSSRGARQAKPSRKEARKQQRTEKKQSKVQRSTVSRSNIKRPIEQEHEESPRRKKPRLSETPAVGRSAPSNMNKNPSESVPRQVPTRLPTSQQKNKAPRVAPKPTALEKLAARVDSGAPSFGRGSHKSQEERDEDAYIARLEAKLGKRSGKLSKEWQDDGLDDLLNDLDTLEKSLFDVTPDSPAEDEDGSEMEEGDLSHSEEDSDTEDEDELSEQDDSDRSHSEGDSTEDVEEWRGFEVSSAEVDEESDSAPELLPVKAVSASGSAYVPPHLRNRESEGLQESEEQIKLKRQLKGLLNRLSEQNIASILEGIEEIYRNNRRHDVTSTITGLIVDGISAHSILLDSYVVLHAALVSALHKLIGVEFAAHFVQTVVANYEKFFAAFSETPAGSTKSDGVDTEDSKGKETSNLIVLLSELYNFQVISCLLVYDVIRGLLEGDLTEFKVELLLKITRSSGQQLRSDDPTALKDIIQIVHSKLPEQQSSLSSRTRFMIETLSNLKNNRVKKAAAGQHAGGDAVERMKKFLSGLTKKRQGMLFAVHLTVFSDVRVLVRAHEPLRVTLKDLHSADTKGKWWLVGAGWGGDPLAEHQEATTSSVKVVDGPGENTLMKLARKQGMNTEIRRNIFVALMSSSDYVEACDRLSQLRLTEIQQREFIRALLHCCGNEKRFNPYYTLVGQQLCRTSKSHQFTLQYCLWDFLRDLGETNVGGAEILNNMKDDAGRFDVQKISEARLSNVAKAYGWWIAKDCCSLAILKPVDFTILQPQTRSFLTQLLMYTLISTQQSTPILSANPEDHPDTHHRGPLEEVFIKSTRVQALALGLIYFIGEMGHAETEESETKFMKWARKVALDTLRTGMDVVPNL